MKKLASWKIGIITFIITSVLIYAGYHYGEEMHWIFKEVQFDTAVFDDENIIRVIHEQNTSNTLTFKVTNIEGSVVSSDRIDTVVGVLQDNEEIIIKARMFDKDIIYIDPGDIITVTGSLDYDNEDHVLEVGCLVHGGMFSKLNPARFSEEYKEVAYAKEY